ncbi:DUF4288 domain-containing protein [Luteibacter yeojuensis]|nr:DUF4288 domain-containing protein [Luteibacter yeojuensis]
MCAHLIFYYKCAEQDSILVHENVHLIEADSAEDANRKALELGREGEILNEDGTLTIDDKPAQYLFAGVRKIITVVPAPGKGDADLTSGMEVTYSQFEVDDEEALRRLADGEGVDVFYEAE